MNRRVDPVSTDPYLRLLVKVRENSFFVICGIGERVGGVIKE